MPRSVSPPARRPDRGQRGLAVVLVSVIGLLTMALWMLAYRATHDTIRAERFTNLREDRDNSTTRALAMAIDLCRTGIPPKKEWQCVFTIVDGADTFFVTATYKGKKKKWTISTALATDAEIISLPPAPPSF